jgi:plastocyanin
VQANSAVKFTMAGQDRQEVHTVTFAKDEVAQQMERTIVSVSQNGAPTLVLRPDVFYPSDPPPLVPPHTGSNHGDGFLNTGALDNVPLTPVPQTATITFTNPGAYRFHCIIHPGMNGTVTVTA